MSSELMDLHADRLLAAGAIRSEAVEAAFRSVPRHLFIETPHVHRSTDDADGVYEPVAYDPTDPSPEMLERIYAGQPIVTKVGERLASSSSSESSLVATMLELLRLEPGMSVLEVGTGSGYNAALMSHLVGEDGRMVTVDNQPDVVDAARRGLRRAGRTGVETVLGDGFGGHPPAAPYDRIVVTVGTADVAPSWIAQLDEQGELLLPLRVCGANPLVSVSRAGGDAVGRMVGWSGFMRITGRLSTDGYFPPPIPPLRPGRTTVPVPNDLPTEGWGRWSTSHPTAGFWFYLALVDHRSRLTAWNPLGFGLVAESGDSVRIFPDGIVVDGSDELLTDLMAHHSAWNDLGRPRVTDFELAFSLDVEAGAHVDTGQGAEPASTSPWQAREWSIPGGHFRKVARLVSSTKLGAG